MSIALGRLDDKNAENRLKYRNTDKLLIYFWAVNSVIFTITSTALIILSTGTYS